MSDLAKLLDGAIQKMGRDRLRSFYFNEPGTENAPYPWQAQFHAAGQRYPYRCLCAANRVGKSLATMAEVSIHLTGLYPPWWEGHRFDKPVKAALGCETGETLRDPIQSHLLGEGGEPGLIPETLLLRKQFRSMTGIPGVWREIAVKHVSGGISTARFLSYDQGRRRWQGFKCGLLALDEQPPSDIFTEAITRVEPTGQVILSFTPLQGYNEVVMYFLKPAFDANGEQTNYVQEVTWDDAPHLTEDHKRRLLDAYPEHERETRSRGVPMKGTGGIYNVPDVEIECDAFEIPDHWPVICGHDFGHGHPAASVWLAHDRQSDKVYLYDAYKIAGQTAPYHANAMNQRGRWIPVAWPHDGNQREKSSGRTLADAYIEAGANMLPESAKFEGGKPGPQPNSAAIEMMLNRMMTGRFKVFRHLREWFEEKAMYHYKDGKAVRKNDDLLKATEYGMMMLRFAVAKDQMGHRRQDSCGGYNPLTYARGRNAGRQDSSSHSGVQYGR